MSHLTVASLNTRGIPMLGSRLSDRYTAIGAAFEASAVDVVSFQEVATYFHLRQLVRAMPSYPCVSYRRSVAGPAGGLLTLSRGAVSQTGYQRFPALAERDGLPTVARIEAAIKGMLVTRLAGIAIVNTHLTANRDGDWSESNRFHGLHRLQLDAVRRYVATVERPAIVNGDFNVSRDSSLYHDFIRDTGLVDAFGDHCPPTFHSAYLEPGKPSHCIDFLLLSGRSITAESAQLTFTTPGEIGYLSDHLGLEVSVAF